MRDLTYYVGASLDGYIAGPDGEVDVYPVSEDHVEHMVREYPEVLPTHVRRQFGLDELPNRRFDTAIMGRATYRPALDIGVTDPYAHLRTFVASAQGVQEARPPVEVVADPLGTVERLRAEPSELGIWLVGGGRLASALAAHIDRLIVKLYPVTLGAGISMLGGDDAPRAFDLVDSVSFSSGCTQLTYERSGTDEVTQVLQTG